MKTSKSCSVVSATSVALALACAASMPAQAASPPVPAGIAAKPVHGIGHGGHFRAPHRHHWSGSVYFGTSWLNPWPWYGPSLSAGYWGRHGGVVVPVAPIVVTRDWIDRDFDDEEDRVWAPRARHRDVPTPTYVKTEKSPTDELAMTAQRGQTLTQQSFDRIDCERAAIRNTGYEPAAGGGAVKKAEWVKDVAACMSGKGYAVK